MLIRFKHLYYGVNKKKHNIELALKAVCFLGFSRCTEAASVNRLVSHLTGLAP